MKKKIVYTTVLVLTFLGCQEQTPKVEPGTIKISILYPQGEGTSFDMDYYVNKHMPMVAELFGDPLIGYHIEKGITGRSPEDPLPYAAIGIFYFETLEAYQNAFAPHADQILGDIPNYTDIQPVVQIGEVMK